ncbi:hypothetical protein ILYODFUR_029999 [Ilyodon furcidens]|uniref:FIIND domain-containing protein n=1 Tax=Ilyodon furcidens TaxID=33524 RepID=A0ABV0SRC1_9TELE
MKTEYLQVSYRFMCPGPGAFQCTFTGLVFVMTREAEVLYRTVLWPDGLLESAGKTPAGMLFNIECSEGSISQLHLPHCETKKALCFNRFLSVAHITDDDGMNILEPMRITDTHVSVNVPHLSNFGLVWDTIRSCLHMTLPLKGQVLLFLRPPSEDPPILDVLLLQENIPLSEVSVQYEESKHFKVSSECLLTADHSYSVRCEPQASIDPENKTFRKGCGPNFHPTFVISMTTNPERVTLVLQDQHCTEVWKHNLYISNSGLKTLKLDPDRRNNIKRPSSRETSTGVTLQKRTSLKRKLFHILGELSDDDFDNFKWFLKDESLDGSSLIQEADLENAKRRHVVDLIMNRFKLTKALKVIERVLKNIGKNNLVEELQTFH